MNYNTYTHEIEEEAGAKIPEVVDVDVRTLLARSVWLLSWSLNFRKGRGKEQNA
jgi:hypothetical protein